MPISCAQCREHLQNHLADLVAPKSGGTLSSATARNEESALFSTPQQETQAHLAQCDDCAREFALLRSITTETQALPVVPPPGDLRSRISAQIAQEAAAIKHETPAPRGVVNRRDPLMGTLRNWRDIFRRPKRVAWAGSLAATAFVLFLALQTPPWFSPTERDPLSGTMPNAAAPDAGAPDAAKGGAARQELASKAPSAPRAQRNTSRPSTTKRAAQNANSSKTAATRPQMQEAERRNSQNAGASSQRALPATPEITAAPLAKEPTQRETATDTAAKPRSATPIETKKTPSQPPAKISARQEPAPKDSTRREAAQGKSQTFAHLENDVHAQISAAKSSPEENTAMPTADSAFAPPASSPAAPAIRSGAQNDEGARASLSAPVTQSGAAQSNAAPQGNAEAASGGASSSTMTRQRRAAAAQRKATPLTATEERAAPNSQPSIPPARESNNADVTSNGVLNNRVEDAARARTKPSTPYLSGTTRFAHALRLKVTPPRDIKRARIRILAPGNLRFSGPYGSNTPIVWSGAARRENSIHIALRLQQKPVVGSLRVILEEAHGAGWKTVREQFVALPGR